MPSFAFLQTKKSDKRLLSQAVSDVSLIETNDGILYDLPRLVMSSTWNTMG